MKPEITIATDSLGVTTIEVEVGGVHVDTIRLSEIVLEALRKHLLEEAAE